MFKFMLTLMCLCILATNANSQLDTVMLGYMWGGERKISQSLSMTQADPTVVWGVCDGTETRTD
jgi:hypothetical protein